MKPAIQDPPARRRRRRAGTAGVARRRPGRAGGTGAAVLLAALLAAACATAPPPAPPAPAPSGTAAAVPVPAVRVSVPEAAAPSGVLYRVGLKSDATELTVGTSGTLWIVASGDHAELVQAPIVFRPAPAAAPGGPTATASPAQFQVQAGAFSQEDPARRLADRLTAALQTTGEVAFSADRGVYRVLLGAFATKEEAEELRARLKEQDADGFVVPGSPRPAGAPPASISVTGTGARLELPSPIDVFPPAPDVRVSLEGVAYRGSLRVAVNPRGTLNAIGRLDLEEYLYGVVPAEMGPKRFDAIEALKAQAVAARTYALAHRGQFESEGYDICATPKCQVYSGVPVEDPLSSAAVDATRGLVIAYQGQFADALFVSTCGGVTENVENVFSGGPVPYLVSVECGELAPFELAGAAVPRDGGRPRSPLEWRGYVLRRHASAGAAPRAAALETAQGWAGVPRRGAAPPRLTAAAVYPSIVAAFGLGDAAALHLTPRDERYYTEAPSASASLTGPARSAYDFLIRSKLAGDLLPASDRELTEDEYAGLLLSADLRLLGVTEGTGRLLSREGSHLWIKTTEGRQELPVDPDVPLARRIGDTFHPARTLTLRAGDRLRFFKRDARVLAIWVEMESDGPSFERDSAWTEWVRRVSGKELARRMGGRVAGNTVREVTVTRRSPTGRAIEMRVQTDLAEATFRRFELRQAVEMPEMLFTVSKLDGADGPDFLFIGRGWGHGVGMCQNGAFGMALGGATYDQILRRYYTGVEIVTAGSVQAGPPSTR